jgi:multidrug resistance efflux pump
LCYINIKLQCFSYLVPYNMQDHNVEAIIPTTSQSTSAAFGSGQKNWSALTELGDDGFYQSWIQQLYHQVPSAHSALLVIKADGGQYQPTALWPTAAPELEQLSELTEQVISQRSGLVTELETSSDGQRRVYGVAYPLQRDGQLLAVTAIAALVENETDVKSVMQKLQWSASWLELKLVSGQLQQSDENERRLSASVDLLGQILSEPKFNGAALRLVSELAASLHCVLVSFGEVKAGSVLVRHLSNSVQFGKQMNLVRGIEAAMNEAVDQHATVLWPLPRQSEVEHQPRTQTVSLAHSRLAQQQDETVLTIPLFKQDECVGAVTLQRDISEPFSHIEADYCESLLALASASLEEKRQNDKALIFKLIAAWRDQLERLIGPGYLGRKLAVIIAILCLLFFSVVEGEYRLSADAKLKPVRQQAVVAPFDGYIEQAQARAGDIVKQGSLLVQLDDRDLQLEKFKWLGQQNKFQRQYQEAMAEHDRAHVNILNAQLQQAEAQLNLVKSQLQRAKQDAPFDGLLISGDLSQRLGGTVSKGELLFEISPLNDYRIDLLIKESRIADVQEGQNGTVYLSALPHQGFKFIVGNVTPVTITKEGATFFVVKATLQEPIEQLRPGMEGVGKISIDERKLIAIWTQGMMEWLRLKQWAWWG